MQRVYACLDYELAETIKNELVDKGIDSYIIEPNKTSSGKLLGGMAAGDTWVYIRNPDEYKKARKLALAKEAQILKGQKNSRDIEKAEKPTLAHYLYILAAVLFAALWVSCAVTV